MTNVIPFAFEGTDIRVVDRDGEYWFVLTDVCRVLDVGNSRDAASRLDEDEKGVGTVDTPGGAQEMGIVNLSGLYSLILTSRKPNARRFKKWIASDLTPALHRSAKVEVKSEYASDRLDNGETKSPSIIPFSFDGGPVRTVLIDGDPWFVGADVAERLGYADTTNALKQHCRGVVKRHPIVDKIGRPQEVRILSEPDVLRLIIGSKLPAAERFERWVFEEVLPTLRRTGRYAMPSGDAAPDRAPLPDLDDMDVDRLWLNKITLAMRVYGRKAAREVWEASPLTRPSPAARRGDDPRDPVVRRRRPSAVRPEVRTEMVRRFRNGEKAEALAREIGVSRHAIHIWNRRQAQRDRMHGRPPA